MCSFADLKNGTVTLTDIASMNEYLDMELENELRIRAAQKP